MDNKISNSSPFKPCTQQTACPELIRREVGAWGALILLFLTLLTSCEKLNLEDIQQAGDIRPSASLHITTRAAEGSTLTYPLHVYAFNTSGQLVTGQVISSASESLSLSLSQDVPYKVVVLSADETYYNIPSNPTATSAITLKPVATLNNATTSPLQMGIADIIPTADNSTLHIQLHYQVASLSAIFTNMPSECNAVVLSVASPTSSLALSGQASAPQTTRIPCTLQSGSWHTGYVYLFPTATDQPSTFTIAYNDSQGEQFATAVYRAPLQAGTPYQLNAQYTDGALNVTGDITPSEWSTPVIFNFTFDSTTSTTITPGGNTGSDDPSSDTYPVTTIPAPLSIWNGHLVLSVDDTTIPAPVPRSFASGSTTDGDTSSSSDATVPDGSPSGSTTLLLMSLTDWGSLPSALNAETPNLATDIASSYTEYDLTNWRIPTTEEARQLYQLYQTHEDDLLSLLTEADADPIVLTDTKGNNLRYLCEGATKTYSFTSNQIKDAGATVKTYRLRLVRTVKIQLTSPN